MHAADERGLAPLPDVRNDAASADRRLAVAERIAFIEAQVDRPAWPARSLEDDGVERRGEAPLVVRVRRAEHDRVRDASAVR